VADQQPSQGCHLVSVLSRGAGAVGACDAAAASVAQPRNADMVTASGTRHENVIVLFMIAPST
jgi:hypothetical protein